MMRENVEFLVRRWLSSALPSFVIPSPCTPKLIWVENIVKKDAESSQW